ncbi:fimbrial protein [Glaciimonas immobilis]|uniref:Type 1 fimbria pilin n=1 Tax=Glaciimonas immobilis TaxID=728004 RepID=A0A840S109_9BURK|nr:fimbrial protein [Glaciimonas immobilis]KAF3997224.1 fimbrial protein [Glaciimonas immobilis]MBB5202269.1 type 1 fimbria pilin [Glaciimonas immobilis]
MAGDKSALVVTPPLSWLDAGKENILRIVKRKGADFSGSGTKTKSTPFYIVLNCPSAGDTAFNIYTQIDTTTPIGDLVGVIGLTPEPDVAQGIGIQLSDEAGKPINLGTPVLMGRHAGAESQQTISLQAAYLQISEKPTAGVANGAVTFTMRHK